MRSENPSSFCKLPPLLRPLEERLLSSDLELWLGPNEHEALVVSDLFELLNGIKPGKATVGL